VFVISVVHTLAESTTLSDDAVAAAIAVYEDAGTVRMSECGREDKDETLSRIVEST
jgi:hypothetical protein